MDCQRNALRSAQQGGLWDVPGPLKAQKMSSEAFRRKQEAQYKFGMPLAYTMWSLIGVGILLARSGQESYAVPCFILACVIGFYLIMKQKSRARTNGQVGLVVSGLLGVLASIYCFL